MSHLQLVRDGREPTPNPSVRRAIERLVKEGVIDRRSASVLHYVIKRWPKTEDQLRQWVDTLLADHPEHRRVVAVSHPTIWQRLRRFMLWGSKPGNTHTTDESVESWCARAEALVESRVAALTVSAWAERHLCTLKETYWAYNKRTHKLKAQEQYALTVLRWALIQLLTIPAGNDSRRATG